MSAATHTAVCALCRLLVTGVPATDGTYGLIVTVAADPWASAAEAPRCSHFDPALNVALVAAVPGSLHPIPPAATTWCPECRHRIEVEGTSFEGGDMRPDGEYGCTVTWLACGHHLSTRPERYASAPGAPYAGPETAVAASNRPVDLRDARTRQRALDRLYGYGHDL